MHLSFIDLFAGAGGLSQGVQDAGFALQAAIERDADAAATLVKAHPGVQVLCQDLATVERSELGPAPWLIVGGPPCQPFSVGGLAKGSSDCRDGSPLFLQALQTLRPYAFIIENVPGLASSTHGGYLTSVIQRINEAGYQVQWAVVQASHFGVPQMRRRLFIVGARSAAVHRWPHILDRMRASSPVPAGRVIGPRLSGEPNRAIVTYARNPSLRPNPCHGHLFNGGGRPIDLAAPAPTLLASMGGNKTPWVDTANIVPSYHAWLLAGGAPRQGVVPGARRISTQEAAALQTFPPDYPFVGTVSSRYRQIGNAVPVRLAYAVATALRCALGG